jgi:hypothetical protein
MNTMLLNTNSELLLEYRYRCISDVFSVQNGYGYRNDRFMSYDESTIER